MKSKSLLYILLPLAFAIWGVIGYKIWKSLSAEDAAEEEVAVSGLALPRTKARPEQPPALQLNYSDPFLGQRVPVKAPVISSVSPVVSSAAGRAIGMSQAAAPVNILPASAPPAAPVLVWPTVVYRGLIENRQKGTRIGILAIDGTDYLLREQQSQRDLTLVRLYPDSVAMLFQKHRKTFHKM